MKDLVGKAKMEAPLLYLKGGGPMEVIASQQQAMALNK